MRRMGFFYKPKIRYYRDTENGGYYLKINKEFLDERDISFELDAKSDVWEVMLIDTYGATKERTRHNYPMYKFKTLNDAKNAINYLRSLIIMSEISV